MVSRYRRQRAIWLAGVAGGIVLAGLLVLGGVRAQEARAQAGPRPLLTGPGEVLGKPRRFLSQPVLVQGEIGRVWNNRAFALRDRAVRQGLLVVLGDGALQSEVRLREGQAVEVVGRVHLLTREEALALGQDIGVGLRRDNLQAIYAQRPFILAEAVKAR